MQSKTSVRDRRNPEAFTTALDTSVVLASLLNWHQHHQLARDALLVVFARGDDVVLPGHALVEAYAVMTRLPSGKRVAPAAANEMLRRSFRARARIVTLWSEDIWPTLDESSSRGVAGGLMYDARILAAARKAGADLLLTLNVRDYERLDPGNVRIVVPGQGL